MFIYVVYFHQIRNNTSTYNKPLTGFGSFTVSNSMPGGGGFNKHEGRPTGGGRTILQWTNNMAYLSSLTILAVVYRFFYLPTANLPIYHNLPISTDFVVDLPNFNFFYRSFCYFM